MAPRDPRFYALAFNGLLDQTPLDSGLINQLLAVINALLGQF